MYTRKSNLTSNRLVLDRSAILDRFAVSRYSFVVKFLSFVVKFSLPRCCAIIDSDDELASEQGSVILRSCTLLGRRVELPGFLLTTSHSRRTLKFEVTQSPVKIDGGELPVARKFVTSYVYIVCMPVSTYGREALCDFY